MLKQISIQSQSQVNYQAGQQPHHRICHLKPFCLLVFVRFHLCVRRYSGNLTVPRSISVVTGMPAVVDESLVTVSAQWKNITLVCLILFTQFFS